MLSVARQPVSHAAEKGQSSFRSYSATVSYLFAVSMLNPAG